MNERLGVKVPDGSLTPTIRKSIEKAIAEAIPPTKRGAVVAVATQDGVVFGMAVRVGSNVKLSAEAIKEFSTPGVSGSVSIVGTF